MTNIKSIKKQIEQLEAKKQNLLNRASDTERKNATSRKIEIGVALLKLAESDATVHAVLSKVWAVAKDKRPVVFIDIELPAEPKGVIKNV